MSEKSSEVVTGEGADGQSRPLPPFALAAPLLVDGEGRLSPHARVPGQAQAAGVPRVGQAALTGHVLRPDVQRERVPVPDRVVYIVEIAVGRRRIARVARVRAQTSIRRG